MQIYLYSGDINPKPVSKKTRSSEQLWHERQLLKFVPFKAPGFPLIARDSGQAKQRKNADRQGNDTFACFLIHYGKSK